MSSSAFAIFLLIIMYKYQTMIGKRLPGGPFSAFVRKKELRGEIITLAIMQTVKGMDWKEAMFKVAHVAHL